MRLYTEVMEETLRTRKLLKEWADDGYLSKEQYADLQQDVPTDLRTTNIFLRLVLLFFTVVGVAAAAALFVTLFLQQTSESTLGVVFLIFAAGCYVAATAAVVRAHFYRHGIEEAFAVCSVAFLCGALEVLLLRGSYPYHWNHLVMLAAGAIFSLWIWVRFGLWYAFPAAMIFVLPMPGCWTSSDAGQHGLAAALFVAGLGGVVAVGARNRSDALRQGYSIAEAFLWLGIYLVLNLKIAGLLPLAFGGRDVPVGEFSRGFYWTTWVLIWCLPPLVLARAIRQKDRFVLAVGMLVTILTFVTNKPYLGWQRHTWDPMILGVVLTGVAFFLRRWLEGGAGGVRHGFTAARLSGKEQHAINAGSALLGLITPHSVAANSSGSGDDGRFGGASGGGGASGDF